MPFLWSTLLTVVPPCIFYLWAVRVSPWFATRRRGFAVGLASFAALQMALHWSALGKHWTTIGGVEMAIMIAGVALALASVPLGIVIGASWVVDRSRGGAVSDPRSVTRRQMAEGAAGVALFGATGAMLGWGFVRGRHDFQLTELAVTIDGLPRVLDGYVIAQVSDIHTGTWVGERDLDLGLSLVRRARPDLIVVTGDLVDSDAGFGPLVARKLSDLPSRDGVVASLGNHDYYAGADRVRRSMRAAGIEMLVDEARVMRPADGGGFALLGVDDLASRRYGRSGPRLDRALSMVAPTLPRILLSHQPHTVDLWAGQVALQLSGHTHGGQINPASALSALFEYIAGRYAVGGTTLYVSRGFGTVGPPVRVNSPPEVTRIVLVAG
jgi:predicted MPP superfamily phosphohydrolase